MKTGLIVTAILAVLSTAPSAARAGTGIEPGALELYPTYASVGIELPYAGDDDGNAAAEFVWRKAGEDAWRNGVDMTIDRDRKRINASIWPLEQGTGIEVKVTLTDGGAPLPPIDGKVSVRRMVLENSGGRVFYVAPSGDDSAAGTKEAPFRTLAHASSVAAAGDTVYAMSGVYHEANLFKGLVGQPDRPIIFAAAPGEKPVIDGSMTIPAHSGVWQPAETGENLYVALITPPTFYLGYVAQDAKRMYRFWGADEMVTGGARTPWGTEYKVGRAWHYDPFEFMVYVRTGDGSNPDDHTYQLAIEPAGVWLDGSRYVVVKGFEVRYFGEAAVRISGGSVGCVVTECKVHNAPLGFLVRGEDTRDNAIWRNDIYEEGLVDFTWNAIKGSEYPRQGTRIKAGRGTSVCYNTIHGYFDGAEADSWNNPTGYGLNRDMDIMFNDFYNIGDDAMEPDGGGINMRIHGNRIRSCFCAISLAPVERGPVYCTRNDASYKFIMFKLNVGGCTSLGWAYCYHNSGYTQVTGSDYGGIAISFPPADAMPISNKVFRNNAIVGKTYGIRYAYRGYSLDYDCFYHAPDNDPLAFTWQTEKDGKWDLLTFHTLGEFAKATGQESHGIYADPRFVAMPDVASVRWRDFGVTALSDFPLVTDLSAGNLNLRDGSPCIDAGVVIRGINEDFKGKAPDIGAFEEK